MVKKNHWKYEGRPRYNPAAEGYGNAQQWNSAFYARMGFEEAQRVKEEAQASGKWRSEFRIIGDMAGVNINEGSVWIEIKAAFRKAAQNCHPDRASVHGKSKEVAEEEFKQVSAAYTILEKRYN